MSKGKKVSLLWGLILLENIDFRKERFIKIIILLVIILFFTYQILILYKQ